jgi:hypothetical protein
MKMISTPSAVAANQYPAYVHNCLRNAACERSFSAPLPGVPYLQTYVDFGTDTPVTMEWTLVDTCTGDTEQIVPSNYVVGQTPEGNWYGVFKYFNSPVNPVTTFVAHLSAYVDTGAGPLQERTFFTQMLMVEPCDPLMKIKSCQPEQATTTGFDINGVYYGLPVNLDYLGIAEVRFFHIAYVRLGKVREMQNKATFKSSLYRNFRTTVEKLHQIETELVPRWYKDELLAIYARGAVNIDDTKTYLVSDLNFEALNDDDLTWKPFAQLRETFRLFYGCDDSECVECCSPIVLDAYTTAPGGGGSSEAPSSAAPSSEAPSSEPPPPEFNIRIENTSLDITITEFTLDGVAVPGSYATPGNNTDHNLATDASVDVHVEWASSISGQHITLYDTNGVNQGCATVSMGDPTPEFDWSGVDMTGPLPLLLEVGDGTC